MAPNINSCEEGASELCMSITQYFTQQLASSKINSDSIALRLNDQTMTFGELHAKSNALANILCDELNGIQNSNPNGDKLIAVCMRPSMELIVTMFAISKAGAAYIPIEESFPDSRVQHIVWDSFPMLLITEEINKDRFHQSGLSCKIITSEELLLKYSISKEASCPMETGQSVAIVMYTSGSSGKPKGVRVTHRGILNRIFWQWDKFPYSPLEKCCMKTTFTFGDSVAEIFGPLLAGVCLCIIPQTIVVQTDLFVQTLEEYGITRIVVVPTLLRNILDLLLLMDKDFLRDVKLWVCSGEALDVDLCRKFFNFFSADTTLCNFYGSTEVTFDATYEIFENLNDVENKIDDGEQVPIGMPIWNAQTHLLDENMKSVPNGNIGEIYVGGSLVASGYVGGKMADKFVKIKVGDEMAEEMLFRTGDMGVHRKSKGGALNLYFEGRNDAQVKVRGNRVDLKEIELTLSKMDGVKEAILLCHKRNTQEQIIVAFVITKATTCEILDYLKHELQSYQMPDIFKIEDKPLLVNGKIDRQKLLQIYEEAKQENDEIGWELPADISAEDRFLTQAILESIVEVINVSGNFIVANMNQSFYSLGGNSQNTIKVILQLKEKGIHIEIRDFVKAKSISEIVTYAKLNQEHPGSSRLCTSYLHSTVDDFTIEPLAQCHREAVIKMVSYADAHKADIFVLMKVTEKEVSDWFESVYDSYVEGGLSFVVKRSCDGKIIGSAINKPFTNAASLTSSFKPGKGFSYYFEFLKSVDQSQKEKAFQMGKNILRSGGVETCASLTSGENVAMIQFIEEINLRLAKEKGFDGIISTNNNACTQQVVRDVLGYEVLIDQKLKEFKASDGTFPFIHARDSQRSICGYKNLT